MCIAGTRNPSHRGLSRDYAAVPFNDPQNRSANLARAKFRLSMLIILFTCQCVGINPASAAQSDQSSVSKPINVSAELHRHTSDVIPPFEIDLTLTAEGSSQVTGLLLSFRISIASLTEKPLMKGKCITLDGEQWRRRDDYAYQRFSKFQNYPNEADNNLESGSYRYELVIFEGPECDPFTIRSMLSDHFVIAPPPQPGLSTEILPHSKGPRVSNQYSKLSLLEFTVSRAPEDIVPPYDFMVTLGLQLSNSNAWEWKSTRLDIRRDKEVVGGSKRCSESPRPDIKWLQSVSQHKAWFKSDNQWGSDFDWRLFEGDHEFTIYLFSEPNCRGAPIWQETVTTPLVKLSPE